MTNKVNFTKITTGSTSHYVTQRIGRFVGIVQTFGSGKQKTYRAGYYNLLKPSDPRKLIRLVNNREDTPFLAEAKEAVRSFLDRYYS